jgi:hypothetical protein
MGKFPYSIIGTGKDLYVEFVSSPAGPLLNTGFHFNVGNWPGHVDTASAKNGSCDWILSSETLQAKDEGIFLSVAHWYPPYTSCTYLLKGRKGEIARLYFPSFRVNRIESPIQPYEGDCAESLTLYDADWADDARIIKTFCDTFSKPMEKHDFVSTSNSLFVRFESKTGSYSGSSLYYWAHYDFFNATKFGEPVPNTECDEIFSSWKSGSGKLRSPLNTLLYKRPGDPANDLACTYTFITDKRLYARIILTLHSVNFKEHPYAPCAHCWGSRADRVIIYEPQHPLNSNSPNGLNLPNNLGSNYNNNLLVNFHQLPTSPSKGYCRCKLSPNEPPIRIISRGEKLELKLLVDGAHAATSYFKQPAPLFEASFEFVHSPLCGPAILQPTTYGKLEFPHYDALSYVAPPRSIKCIWELRVNVERDLWLHLDKTKFASRSCEDGKLEIFLPASGGYAPEPHITICGENVSYVKEIPILTAAQIAPADPGESGSPSVTIQFTGSMALARAEFKIEWTELYHLPRDNSGNLNVQKLEDCAFQCPADAGCIPQRLLCDGVINCPKPPGTIHNSSIREPDDESQETCGTILEPENNDQTSISDFVGSTGWAGAGLGAALAILLGLCCLICTCRMCKKSSSSRDIHVPY